MKQIIALIAFLIISGFALGQKAREYQNSNTANHEFGRKMILSFENRCFSPPRAYGNFSTMKKLGSIPKQRLDSTIRCHFDNNTQLWNRIGSQKFIYDENNRNIEYIRLYSWDGYTNNEKYIYTYDINGIISKTTYIYLDENLDISSYQKYMYGYDVNGNLCEEKVMYFSRDSTIFCTYKTEYNYDVKGRLVLLKHYLKEGADWLEEYEKEYFYDENGFLDYRLIYSYDEEGKPTYGSKEVYTCNEKGDILQELSFSEDVETKEWKLESKSNSVYTDFGMEKEYLYYVYRNELWILSEKIEYQYGEDKNIEKELYYLLDDETGELRLDSESSYSYDSRYSYSDLILPFGYENFDWFNHMMTHSNSIDYYDNKKTMGRTTFYYSIDKQTLSEKNIFVAPVKVFPNPVRNKLHIQSSSNYNNATIEIFDLKGRKIIHKKLKGKNHLNLEGLDNGTYSYRIFDNNIVKSGKFIKK